MTHRRIYYGLRLYLQCCIIALYLLLKVVAFHTVSLLTVSYVYILSVATHNHNSVQSFNSSCLRTVPSPSHDLCGGSNPAVSVNCLT